MLPVRLLFSVPRSGSTLFMSIMSNLDDVAVTSRTILMGNYYKTGIHGTKSYQNTASMFTPDHSIFNGQVEGDGAAVHPVVKIAAMRGAKCLISKEEVGNNLRLGDAAENECNFRLYPNERALRAVRPVFVFRHPVACYASWYKLGWHDLDGFITAYKNVVATADKASEARPETVIYKLEDITSSPKVAENVFSAICRDWDLPYSPSMLSLDREFADRFVFWHPREQKIYREENPKGIFTSLKSAKSILTQPAQAGFVPDVARERIEAEVLPLYDRIDTTHFRSNARGAKPKTSNVYRLE